MRQLYRTAILSLIIILFISISALCATKVASKAKAKPKPKPVAVKPIEWAAKVNGDIVSMDRFNKLAEAVQKQYSGQISSETQSTVEVADETKKQILEQMIEAVELMQWAEREGLVINDKIIKAKIAEVKKGFPSNKEFHKSLAEQGMNINDLERDVTKQIIMEKLINIRAKNMAVSDEEMRAFYDKNSSVYGSAEKVHIEQAFFKQKNDADRIKKYLDGGGNFAGDDMGFIEKGQMMIADEAGVFDLKEGGISRVVNGDNGYYIFRVTGIDKGNQVAFDDAKSTIRTFLLTEKARAQFLKDFEAEKSNAKIIVNDKLKYLFEEKPVNTEPATAY
jgi:parvulin-like peptidyl-prolyl isomerase